MEEMGQEIKRLKAENRALREQVVEYCTLSPRLVLSISRRLTVCHPCCCCGFQNASLKQCNKCQQVRQLTFHNGPKPAR